MYGVSMTTGSPWRHILRFAAPVLIGSFLQHLYTAIDQMVVGRYAGQDALASVGTTVTFTFFFLALAIGLSAGNGVVVSQYFGARNEEKVRSSAAVGVMMLMGFGALMTIFGLLVARPAFIYFVDVPDELLDFTVKYFVVYLYGLIFQFGFNSFSAILRAVGDSASTLYFLLVSSAVNIVLDFVFVAWFEWGVVGAAVATDIAQAVSCVVAYLYMIRKYPTFRFKLRDYKWDWEVAKKSFYIGLPISLHMAVISIGTTLIQRGANGFGRVMTASFAVGRQLELFLNFPSHALQTTLATYTGQNVGAKKLDRVRQGGRQTTILSLAFSTTIAVFLWVFAPDIVPFFGLDSEAAGYCVRNVRAVAIINLVLCSYLPMFGLFQGTGHSAIPAIVATTALTFRCSSVYVFGHSPILGYTIVWWNGIFGYAVGFMITWGYYLSGRWKRGLATEDVESVSGTEESDASRE